MKQILIILAALLLTPFAAQSYGQPPDPGKYSAGQFEVKATRGHKAKMRDDVRLSVDWFEKHDLLKLK